MMKKTGSRKSRWTVCVSEWFEQFSLYFASFLRLESLQKNIFIAVFCVLLFEAKFPGTHYSNSRTHWRGKNTLPTHKGKELIYLIFYKIITQREILLFSLSGIRNSSILYSFRGQGRDRLLLKRLLWASKVFFYEC